MRRTSAHQNVHDVVLVHLRFLVDVHLSVELPHLRQELRHLCLIRHCDLRYTEII